MPPSVPEEYPEERLDVSGVLVQHEGEGERHDGPGAEAGLRGRRPAQAEGVGCQQYHKSKDL